MDRQQTQHMADLITRRRDLMVKILKCSMDQERAISDGLVEQLVSRLNEKQVLVNELIEIQAALKPYSDVDAEQRDWESEDLRLRCGHEIEETERMNAAILEIDTRCERAMVQRRSELFDALNKNTDAATVAKAYSAGAGPKGGGGSFDLSSG